MFAYVTTHFVNQRVFIIGFDYLIDNLFRPPIPASDRTAVRITYLAGFKRRTAKRHFKPIVYWV
jgi:hypothetical protein